MLLNKLNNWLKSSLRLVLTAFICGLLFISSAYPAHAVTSKPTEGEANLNKIQEKTDNLARSNPPGLEETTKEAQKGLNEVQGDANKEKMIAPEDASADTVEKEAGNFLQNLIK
jgi:apolipoprotein N-acyltransferase